MTASWLNDTLLSLLLEHDPKDVYNTDETGFFYRLTLNRTLAIKGEKCSGGERTSTVRNALLFFCVIVWLVTNFPCLRLASH